MRQYGGQQLTTGAQAEVYADRFITNHLKTIGGGVGAGVPGRSIPASASRMFSQNASSGW